MNLTADQSCDHAVFMSSKHARKSERSKNSHLNLLYIHCNFSRSEEHTSELQSHSETSMSSESSNQEK